VDLQLPLYRHLLGHLEEIDSEPAFPADVKTRVTLAYLPLSKEDIEFEPAEAPWSASDLEDADEAAREVIRTLRRDGGAGFQPGSTGRGLRGPLAALLGRGVFQDDEGNQAPEEGEE